MKLIPLTLDDFQQGGETESQKQARLSKELDAKPQTKYTDSQVWDPIRQDSVPSWKFATPPKQDTLFVSNPNDPRLKAYEDSLYFNELSVQNHKDWLTRHPIFHFRAGNEKDNINYMLPETVYESGDDKSYIYKKPTQPVVYKEEEPLKTGRGYDGHWRDENGEYWALDPMADDYKPKPRPKQSDISFSKQQPSQIPANKINLQPTTTKAPESPRLNIKPEVKRQYKEENGKYYMRFFDKKADKEEWRPISSESYRLGQKEADSGIRFGYEDGGQLIRLEL